MPHTQQFEALASGRIDLGVVYQDSGPDVAADRRLLASERLEFIFRRGHPLARQKRLRLADLASEPFIMPTRAHNLSLSERLGAVWASKGFRPRVAAESDSFSTTVMLVSSGAGISFAGRGPASQFSAKVDVRAAEDFDFAWGAELIWSSHNFSPVVGTFLEALPA